MENFVVSALKYRPATFRSVVGQPALTGTLKNAILNRKLAHSYLFCGPRGVGKTTCARIFAKTINCFNPTAEGEACNTCESCVSFNEQRSYNIYELDAASNNSVNDIKSLIDQVRIPPQLGNYKVYIIDEVHMLSNQAFNAFLKTLEEPPAYAIFIMATTEKHKVLPTILSRCQIYDFNRITINDTIAHLAFVAGQEKVRVEPEALGIIAQKADGAMRDALSIFDQAVSYTGGNLTYKAVIENLNVLDFEYYFRLLACFLKGEIKPTLLIFNEIINKGFDGQHFTTGLSSFLRDILVSRDTETLPLLEVGETIAVRYNNAAQNCPIPFLYRALELTNSCDFDYRLSKNKRLSVELTLIRLCQILHPVQIIQPQQAIQAVAQASSTPNNASPQVAQDQKATATSSNEKQPSNQPVVESPVVRPAISSPPPSPKPKSGSGGGIMPMMPWKTNSANTQEVKDEEIKEVEETNSFTEADFRKAWEEYKRTIPESRRILINALRVTEPEMISNVSFRLEVLHQNQKQEILAFGKELLGFLRKHLHNTTIQMQVEVMETIKEARAFSNREKFEEMRKEIPLLETIRRDFGLIVE